MLSAMRKNAQSWIIKFLFGIIVIVFVFFYGFSDVSKQGKETVIASVGERKITMTEYRDAYRNMMQFYRSIYKNQLSDEMIQNMGLKQKVLNDIIDREILLQEAQRREITVSQEQIQAAILTTPSFLENGRFNKKLYERVLGYYGITAMDFEKDKERELTLKSLEDLIKMPVKVSEREIRDAYNLQNEEVKIAYALIDPQAIQEAVAVSAEELSSAYEENKETFRVPEKVKVASLVFDPQDFGKKMEISAEEINDYYEADDEQFFEPHQVKARHILLKVDKDAAADEDAKIKKQAETILAQLKKGKDFAELAKKHSEDTQSAEKGGDLGYFPKGQMVKPFEDQAFAMAAGDLSEPVKSPFGYHIINVLDVKQASTRPLEEVKDTIVKELQQEKAREAVRLEAKRAFNRLFKSKALKEYADKNGFKVKESDFFTFGKSAEDLPGKETFSKEAFALSKGELAPAFSIGEKFYLVKLLARQESRIPAVEEISETLTDGVETEKKKQLARKKAEVLLDELLSGKKTWKDLEAQKYLKTAEVEFKRPGNYITGIGQSADIKAAAFGLEKAGQLGPQAYSTDRGSILFKLTEKTIPDDDAFAKEKESIQMTTLQKKQGEAFDVFLQGLKKETETWVNPKAIPGA